MSRHAAAVKQPTCRLHHVLRVGVDLVSAVRPQITMMVCGTDEKQEYIFISTDQNKWTSLTKHKISLLMLTPLNTNDYKTKYRTDYEATDLYRKDIAYQSPFGEGFKFWVKHLDSPTIINHQDV
eukprot:4887927-Prymnesium_polylepis.1